MTCSCLTTRRWWAWGWSVWLCLAPLLQAATPLEYRVRFRGIDDRALAREIKAASNLEALRNRPPTSRRQLERRIDNDKQRLQDLLRTHGYYQATLTAHINHDRDPIRVRLHVDTGPQYTLRTIEIEPATPFDGPWPSPADIGLEPGQPAHARPVTRGTDRLRRFWAHHGYPFAHVPPPTVRVEHAARAMDLHWVTDPGPLAAFGPTTFHGIETVAEDFLRNKLPWETGDRYDGDAVRRAQRRLMDADLFSVARIQPAEALESDDQLPLRIELQERRQRSVTLGGGYHSDEGARVRLGWEHRNAFSRGERVTTQATVSEIGYVGLGRFRKPDWRRLDQNLTLSLRAARDEPDAFRSRNLTTLLQVHRPLRPGWVGSLGIGYRYTDVEQIGESEYFGLIYSPASLEWDRSDDVLDPRSGWRFSLGTAPYRDVLDTEVFFLKSRATLTTYLPITPQRALTLASRLSAASVIGAAREAIPADERYYAGGGGSIRGYAYQSVGPLEGNRPVGGKSMVLVSNELRWQWTRTLGMVAFIDGGMAYADSEWGNVDDFRWGAGGGFRYFTPVGPLRFDVAFPLDRRSGLDDAYQFYISLGQAF